MIKISSRPTTLLSKVSVWLLALALMVPVLTMFYASISASSGVFSHLWQTVLPDYIQNTLLLGAWVVFLVIVFGVPSAAIISQTNVYGRRFLRWLLLLPLAMPAYLVAYLYTDLFDYAGPVQRFLRAQYNWQSPQDYWFFDIRTLAGAGVIIALVLFPYVYMLTRTAFEQQDKHLLRASRTLGFSAGQTLFKVSIPLARPAIAVAASLVLMETLADFATVQYFAVNTLTTAIYDTWLGYGDIAAANAIASVLTLLVFIVLVLEQRSRAHQQHQTNRPNQAKPLLQLTVWQNLLASGYCWLLVVAGFLLPMILLLAMAFDYSTGEQVVELLDTGVNSLTIAAYVATIATVLALVFASYRRFSQSKSKQLPLQISGFGYAIPGTVLAMAMLATFGPLDHWLNDLAASLNWQQPGLILSGTIFAIVIALVVRFIAIANGTLASGYDQIAKSLDYAPASLGVSLPKAVGRVHLPLLRPSIFVAWLLVFVEAMKELPAVLLLRPFNFDTLSTHIYQLISDERLEQGALGAILIVAFGLLPIIWLNKEKAQS